jgi:hypothetical protein
MQFEHSPGLGGVCLYVGRSLFALCIGRCSQFSTLVTPRSNPSPQYVTVHPVPKFRGCHKAVVVTTGRAHCYTFCIIILYTNVIIYFYNYIKDPQKYLIKQSRNTYFQFFFVIINGVSFISDDWFNSMVRSFAFFFKYRLTK